MPLCVDVAWLHEHAKDSDLVILDASWYMPATGRDGAVEYLREHIPGARFFDFDRQICDRTIELPHMLPRPQIFAEEVRALGVHAHSRIVCYDSAGVFSAPRAWWMFRAMGHWAVAVLDGGLPAWKLAGLALEAGEPATPARGDFVARVVRERVVDRDQVRAALADPGATVIDARSSGRFSGSEPEPRTGLRGGHMPGARNLPFGDVLENGRFRSADQLAAHFDRLAARRQRLICTCGSGITACVIALAAELAGRRDIAVYDGSWTEWGGCPDVPVVVGE